jgi:hypothetical protein
MTQGLMEPPIRNPAPRFSVQKNASIKKEKTLAPENNFV